MILDLNTLQEKYNIQFNGVLHIGANNGGEYQTYKKLNIFPYICVMNKDFTLYPEAFELKELGFDEPCFAYYKDGRITGVNKWDREDWGFHVITNERI